MSENTSITELSSQYTAQVASDLERNTKEQERIADEIAALDEQLAALKRNHAVLVSIRQAIDAVPASAGTAEKSGDAVTVPAPRKQASSAARTAKGAKAAKPAKEAKAAKSAVARRTAKSPAKSRATTGVKAASAQPAAKAADKTAGKAAGKAAPAKATQPTLVDLVRRHLTEQSEPRSAAEVTTALTEAHPERSVKTTVIRTTLEGLVARNHAHRSKQGTSVFYTAADAPESSTSSRKDAAQAVPADA
ncbi:hypothetical protein ABZ330_17765 [Streptomyces sp. NPDC006172]|uniref:hypothetical protein n=1 Tax=Streptomyces sp. NPDC006172 TaxID=3154470 RepID=UPI0033C2DEC4